MKKVKQYKGFVIAFNKEDLMFYVYQLDEWKMGKGFRYQEIECGSIQESIDFIDSY